MIFFVVVGNCNYFSTHENYNLQEKVFGARAYCLISFFEDSTAGADKDSHNSKQRTWL